MEGVKRAAPPDTLQEQTDLTGFELLEMALENWLDTDTGPQQERRLDRLARVTAGKINSLLQSDFFRGQIMSKSEADKLLHSVDHETLAEARNLTTTLLPAMRGGKWEPLTRNQKICILAAVAIKYGERKAKKC